MSLLRKLGTQLGLFVLWLVHFLPLPWIAALGSGLGAVLYRFGRGRVTRINLALCFPEMTERERHELGLRHFRMLGRNALELSVMAWGTEEQLLRMIRVEGAEHLKARRGPAGDRAGAPLHRPQHGRHPPGLRVSGHREHLQPAEESRRWTACSSRRARASARRTS